MRDNLALVEEELEGCNYLREGERERERDYLCL